MPWMLQRLMLVLCFGCAVLGVGPARADSRTEPTNPEARAHFDQGGKLFGLQEFEQAIDEYKQGALIESLPVFDLALGQCYRMLHRYEDALWYFDRFIKYGHPGGKLLNGISDLIAAMRAELEKPAMTQAPAEAAPVVVPEQKPAAPAAPPAPPAPPGSSASPVRPALVTTVDRGGPWYRDTIGWGVAGGGTVAIGIASYLLLDAHRLHDQSNTDPSEARRAVLHDQAGARYHLGAAAGIAGVSVLVAGVIRLARRRPDRPRQVSTAWKMGVAGSGVMIFGKF